MPNSDKWADHIAQIIEEDVFKVVNVEIAYEHTIEGNESDLSIEVLAITLHDEADNLQESEIRRAFEGSILPFHKLSYFHRTAPHTLSFLAVSVI